MACVTQWRMAGFGDVVGLDYAGVHAAMQMLGIHRQRRVFERLRVIESAALKEIARRREKHRPKQPR